MEGRVGLDMIKGCQIVGLEWHKLIAFWIGCQCRFWPDLERCQIESK